jgi:hypothetical protein
MTNSIISCLLTLAVSYFHTKTSKWEPILEKASLGIDLSNTNNNTKKYFILELLPYTETLDFTISLEMLEILNQAIKNL